MEIPETENKYSPTEKSRMILDDGFTSAVPSSSAFLSTASPVIVTFYFDCESRLKLKDFTKSTKRSKRRH